MNSDSRLYNDTLFEDQVGATIPPSPSLAGTIARAFNYTFSEAIADLVDNSIAASASNIWIQIEPRDVDTGTRAYVSITDDGHGMSKARIEEALVYGAISSDDKNNLGRFGLGLKTAGTSQSWIVALATREDKQDSFVTAAWDIPWVEENGWKLRIPSINKFPSEATEAISSTSGTIVFLPDLTRSHVNIHELNPINEFQLIDAKAKKLRTHLSWVFHRFIAGTARSAEYAGTKVNIYVNNKLLEAVDPFFESHNDHIAMNLPAETTKSLASIDPKTGHGGDKPLILNLRGKQSFIRLHLLPSKKQLDKDEYSKGGGPKAWNASQGLYVYRVDRLICYGGWNGLVANDEHTKLARLSIDFDRSWDADIELTATKNRIILPGTGGYKDDFKTIYAKIRTAAKTLEKERRKITLKPPEGNGPKPPEGNGPKPPEGNGPEPLIPLKLDDKTFEAMLDACESNDERNMLGDIWIRAKNLMQ